MTNHMKKCVDVRTLIQTNKAIWRHPYVGKEVWKYIYPKFEAGIITDVQPANIHVGDQVEVNGEEGSIVKILKGQQYRLKFKSLVILHVTKNPGKDAGKKGGVQAHCKIREWENRKYCR